MNDSSPQGFENARPFTDWDILVNEKEEVLLLIPPGPLPPVQAAFSLIDGSLYFRRMIGEVGVISELTDELRSVIIRTKLILVGEVDPTQGIVREYTATQEQLATQD